MSENTPPFDPQRHNRVLLHAWHTTHEVLYRGRVRHIHGLRFMTEGSTHDAVVFLTGDPKPVPADQVTLFVLPTPQEQQPQQGAST